ncbi:peroxidase isoform X2 [Drosophila willistoni]|uniref:peroxidase isoform X2 n=1 Tax=Drosophila willistoni TaxID=7260 RepID=UPI000C26CB0E|nr:peroxidase isoform X2 [Drosophila willistoni]
MWNIICIGLLAGLIPQPSFSTTPFEFPEASHVFSPNVKRILDGLSLNQWQGFVNSGLDSINRQKRLEENLVNSAITVQNGSVSHAQLLDTLPNKKSNEDSDVALKILKSSLFVYNSQCAPNAISGEECRRYLETKPLPPGSLKGQCENLLQSRRDGHYAFRRLLDRHYKNGFHKMYDDDDLPGAWPISMALYEHVPGSVPPEDQNESPNLCLVQWAQFIEHDLSKPVSQSMTIGSPIECCNSDQNKLQPRYHHPVCAPILSKQIGKFGRPNCLNYVRSALAVDNCNFGAAEQLNQATGYLDLSQLYGFTIAAERKMRSFKYGLLKARSNGSHLNDLLPMTADIDNDGQKHTFCTWTDSGNSTCFAAGDSRVNSNPYSILIYTVFMRNHNRIAAELRARNNGWSDEQLFQTAKAINVDIYRRVVMDEWLPEVLGERLANAVRAAPPLSTRQRPPEVSNEFAVAAIRFYYSMLPNAVLNVATENDNDSVQPQTNLFVLEDEIYKPQLQYTAQKLDEILQSLLNQRAMKMDASYVGSITWPENSKPGHADTLAFDIQRGRDHGLQPYYKYLEVCSNLTQVTSWNDLAAVIPKNVLVKLQNVYQSWSDVDLIVGGIAEHTVEGTIGPTFSCILSEQFAKIHQRHQLDRTTLYSSLLDSYRHIDGTKLLCLNSELKSVPKNIFKLPTKGNRLVGCDGVV